MAAKYWLKLYYEMLDDPKIGKLPPVLRWRFIECLLVAGETDQDGLLPEVNEMAWRVREDGERYETELNELTNAGLLSRVDGRYLVTKFSDRQKAVSGAERVARYRERQKKQDYYEGETAEKRDDNASVTKRYIDKIRKDTEKITDTEKNPPTPPEDEIELEMPEPYKPRYLRFLPVPLQSEKGKDTWAMWEEYRSGLGVYPEQSAVAQLRELGEWGINRAEAAIKHSIKKGYKGIYEPKPAVNGRNGHHPNQTPAPSQGLKEITPGSGRY